MSRTREKTAVPLSERRPPRLRPAAVLTGALFLLLVQLTPSVSAQSIGRDADSVSVQSIRMDQGWEFLVDREGKLRPAEASTTQGWRSVRVGLSWNAQFADLRDYMGVGWYRLKLDPPPASRSRRLLLRFDAVDYFSELYVNGRRIGEHEGGYTPFTFDITEAIKPGANELLMRVVDPPMEERENRALFPEMLYNEIPHGKQNWYVQTGGIWQPVWLETRPETYIKELRVIANNDGQLQVFVFSNGELGPPPPAPPPGSSSSSPSRPQTILDRISVRVIDETGKVLTLKLRGGGGLREDDYVSFEGRIPEPRLWSTDHPALYRAEALLGDDSRSVRFGFRSFEARDGRFYLNGEPFYMRGALDQDFYPETIYTTPSEEYVRDQMLKAKRLGLNLLRCHIKVCDPTYLKVADEVGMLVWYEIPSWNDFNHFSERAAERGEKIFAAQVARDWNHPSIVIQSIINEAWGTDLKQAEQRKWLRAAFERAKSLTAPLGRLIVDNSACCDNFHVRTDIEDFHQYYSIPDRRGDWDKWVADFASRPQWTFSPHGDRERTGAEPLVVSEFGNWGLPRLPRALPWWFGRDFGGREVTRPAGVFERFRDFKFDHLFRDYNELAEESQWHQFISLKHEIEEMRRYPSIQGYVITEFTDINWEVNGLMDMWRNPKVYAGELSKIQQPDVILARTLKRNYTSGERVEIATLFSHYGAARLSGASVKWSTTSGARGQFKIDGEIEPGTVAPLEAVSFVAPNVNRPRSEKLSIIVTSAAGQPLAENSHEIFVFPKAPGFSKNLPLLIYDPSNSSPGLAPALQRAGYKVSPLKQGEVEAHLLLVATRLDDLVRRHVQSGGRALILADSKDAFPAASSFKVTAREGSDLDGNWVTNFNWVRSNVAPFSEVALTRLLGFESAAVVPRYIIQGIPAANYDDVMSGIFYGWLNNNAALAVQMRLGSGRILATTFRFDSYGDDPYATRLLDAMIRYAHAVGFAPKLSWTMSFYEGETVRR